MPRGKNEVSSDPAQTTEDTPTPSRPLFKDFLNALTKTTERRKENLAATRKHLEAGKENAEKLKGVILTYRPQ